jgi:hypothetical protein
MTRTSHPHHDRTLRLLLGGLEALAGVAERSLSGPRPLERQLLALEAATRHAVALHVLSREEANAIWVEVADRHPCVPWAGSGCPGLAA